MSPSLLPGKTLPFSKTGKNTWTAHRYWGVDKVKHYYTIERTEGRKWWLRIDGAVTNPAFYNTKRDAVAAATEHALEVGAAD